MSFNMNKKMQPFTYKEHLQQELKNPRFRKAWDESEPEFLLSCAMIENRLKKKMSQRTLAKKVKTSQSVIANIEGMSANPTFDMLKRIATALELKLKVTMV